MQRSSKSRSQLNKINEVPESSKLCVLLCLEYHIFQFPAKIFSQFWCQKEHIGCHRALI